ncbi:MAG: hypothetical protein K2X87_32710 [Gemmataceae bacterium]|nr:hypothetical protein [Gemmataceae bacterium]
MGRGFDGQPAVVAVAGQQKTNRFLAAHAPSRLVYTVPVGAKHFKAVGTHLLPRANLQMRFLVYTGKDQQIHRSKLLKDAPGAAVGVSVDLPPRKPGRSCWR